MSPAERRLLFGTDEPAAEVLRLLVGGSSHIYAVTFGLFCLVLQVFLPYQTISPYLFFWQAGREMEDTRTGTGMGGPGQGVVPVGGTQRRDCSADNGRDDVAGLPQRHHGCPRDRRAIALVGLDRDRRDGRGGGRDAGHDLSAVRRIKWRADAGCWWTIQ